MTVRQAVTVAAHAKINLDLRVLGTRPDTFHEVRTVYQTIRLYDTLRFSLRQGPFTLECASPDIPVDERNLVCRAASVLSRAVGRGDQADGVRVILQKRIPAEAGLGGGSSDAAATLVALSGLWRSNLDTKELLDLASHIGADVPFFLFGGTALGVGRGDEIYPLPDLPPWWVVILKPPFGVATPEAYAWHDDERQRHYIPGAPLYEQEPAFSAAAWPLPIPGSRAARPTPQLRNDLERGVGRRYPEIARMKAALRAGGAEAAAMSGSGPAVFGLFRTRAAAARAAAKLGGGEWEVFVTRTLARRARA